MYLTKAFYISNLEFLERHPEIFPGREQPLSRFQLDRNGFQDWLSRWLSTVQSANVVPNAVYYCDETVWDTTQGPLHNVQFSHKSIALNNISSSSKITTLTCVGADGSVSSPVHIFPGPFIIVTPNTQHIWS